MFLYMYVGTMVAVHKFNFKKCKWNVDPYISAAVGCTHFSTQFAMGSEQVREHTNSHYVHDIYKVKFFITFLTSNYTKSKLLTIKYESTIIYPIFTV